MIFTFNQLSSDANRVARMPLGPLDGTHLDSSLGGLAEKNRYTLEKKLPMDHAATQAENNLPICRHHLEEKHPDHIPSKVWNGGCWGWMRTS